MDIDNLYRKAPGHPDPAGDSDEPTFILNVNEGKDTLHDPAKLTERCNTDQIEGRKVVDEMTAEAMAADGSATLCGHCEPDIRVAL